MRKRLPKLTVHTRSSPSILRSRSAVSTETRWSSARGHRRPRRPRARGLPPRAWLSPSSCVPRWRRRLNWDRSPAVAGASWRSRAARSRGRGSKARCGRAVPTGRSCAPTASPSWTRATRIETDKGQLIYVQNAGMRHAPPDVMQKLLAGQPVDPALVYFRTVPKFETSAPELQWLTRAVFVGTGRAVLRRKSSSGSGGSSNCQPRTTNYELRTSLFDNGDRLVLWLQVRHLGGEQLFPRAAHSARSRRPAERAWRSRPRPTRPRRR